MYFKDVELQKWKVEDLRKYLLQRGVLIGNNARKANLIEKGISAQKLDLPIQPSQEEGEKEILNAKDYKLSIDGAQIHHPNDIKENWITGSKYLPNIVLKNIDEYAELNSAKKASKEGRNLLFSGHAISVKFNPITSSLKYCFVKRVVIPKTRVNGNPYSVWVCIHDGGSILAGDCGCVTGLISSCKHVFTILHYIENEVTLGHNKTCTSKKQKWYVRLYRNSKKIHPPTKIGSVSFTKPHLEYESDKFRRCLSRKISRFDPRSPHNSDVSFCQKDCQELAKATNGTASILRFISTIFSSTSVTTPMTSWPATVRDIVSNLNL